MVISLVKDALDVGIFTERLEESLEFWRDAVGLPYAEMLPIGGGVRQHRFLAGQSVVKVNHSRDPLPRGVPSTLAGIRITMPTATSGSLLADPDGTPVGVIPGRLGLPPTLTVVVRTARAGEVAAFWSALGLDRHVVIEGDATGCYAGDMRSAGFRFLTVQVRDVHSAYGSLTGSGAHEISAPTRMGDVATVSFVADPDGVPIEISQRASLVGHLPED